MITLGRGDIVKLANDRSDTPLMVLRFNDAGDMARLHHPNGDFFWAYVSELVLLAQNPLNRSIGA